MACDFITDGRLEPCKDSVGGINAVYFVDFGDITSVDYAANDSDVIDQINGGVNNVNAYKYQVRGNSTYTENIQSSRENGTTAFEQVLELTLKKLTKEDHKAIKLLSFNRPNILVEDNNGNILLVGLEYGADVTGGTIVTGGAMADMSGYTLTFTGMEKKPANFLWKAFDVASTLSNVGFTVVE